MITTADDPAVWTPAVPVTVWDFTITACPAGLPELDHDWPFTARILPEQDHLGQSTAAAITCYLFSSIEPGHCLNAVRLSQTDWWQNTTPEVIDLKFAPIFGLHVDEFYAAGEVFEPNPIIQTPPTPEYDPDNWNIAWTTEPRTHFPAMVRCLDYGAFGSIAASAVLPFAGGQSVGAACIPGQNPTVSVSQNSSGEPVRIAASGTSPFCCGRAPTLTSRPA